MDGITRREFSQVEHGLYRFYEYMGEFKRIEAGKDFVLEPLRKLKDLPAGFVDQKKALCKKRYEFEKKELSEYLISAWRTGIPKSF